MRGVKKYFLVIIVFISISAFKHEKSKELIGIWVPVKHEQIDEDRVVTYKKKNTLDKGFGIEFKIKSKLIFREKLGWCGTPPISYINREGIWELKSNSKLILKYKRRKVEVIHNLKVLSLKDSILKVKWNRDK